MIGNRCERCDTTVGLLSEIETMQPCISGATLLPTDQITDSNI